MLWLKVSAGLTRHAKVYKLARRLGISQAAAVGYLVQLWSFALLNYPDGEILADADEIAFGVCLDRKIDPQKFLDALCNSAAPAQGFLEPIEENHYRIHDWSEYSGSLEVTKAKNREKNRRWREKKALEQSQDEENDESCDGHETVTRRSCDRSVMTQNKKKNKNKKEKEHIEAGGADEPLPPALSDPWITQQMDAIRAVVAAPRPENLPDLLAQWRETYGAQTVDHAITKAMRWMQDNRRRYTDMGRFLGSWLARDAARTSGKHAAPDYGDAPKDWRELMPTFFEEDGNDSK